MAIYKYAAVNGGNQLSKGFIKARTNSQAVQQIKDKGMFLLNLEKEPTRIIHKLQTYSTVSRLEKIQVTRFLYTFLSSGLSLSKALEIAKEQTGNYRLQDILEKVREDIQGGQSLSKSLETYRRFFGPYYINLIKVGEGSGTLEDTLKHLLEQQERDYELISNVRGAMFYPVIVILAAIAAVTFLMIFVIPTIADVLTDYGSELPIQTKILVATSNFFVEYILFLLPAFVLAIYSFRLLIKTKLGQWYFEAILLKTPLLKKMVVEYNNARIMRALWAPLKSGLNFNKALELAAQTCNNAHYRQSIEKSAELIHRGVPLSEVLRGYKELYPASVYGMIQVGESTGRIDDMLKRLSEFYEQSVNHTFKNISSVIEPILLIFIGLIVGFIVVSVLTPIWKFSETI